MRKEGIEYHIRSGKEEFSALAKGYMSVRKITATDLAKRIGMTTRTLERHLSDGRLRLDQVLAISYVLGFDPELTDRILKRKKSV